MNRRKRTQLVISHGLFFLLIVGVMIPVGSFSTNEHTSPPKFHQEPNAKYSEIVTPKHKLRNSIYHSNQILSHSQEYHEVGDQRTFWTYDFTNWLYYEVNATVLAVGVYCYIFMENSCIEELGEFAAIEQTETIRDAFDNIIYPRVTDLAGHPDGTLGDIDDDPRIIILFSRNRTTYYSQVNDLDLDYSNHCEMFYITYGSRWTSWTLAVVAHEFHHLIWFNNEMDEPPFIIEVLAQYAMYYTGYLAPYNNLAPQVANFLRYPEDSLLYWNTYREDGLSMAIDYGSAYMLAFYIAERYGVDILRNLITEPADGPHGIEAVLQTAGYDITFNELYLNWITALTLDELGFHDNLYGFEEIDAQISQYDTIMIPFLNKPILLRYYGFHIHKLHSPPDNFTVQLTKSANQAIGISVALHDTSGWHIHQYLHDETETTISDEFWGHSVDIVYLITSFMSSVTPTAGPDSRGLGPLTQIEISITEGSPTDSPETSDNSETVTKTDRKSDASNQGFTALCVLGSILLVIVGKKRRS